MGHEKKNTQVHNANRVCRNLNIVHSLNNMKNQRKRVRSKGGTLLYIHICRGGWIKIWGKNTFPWDERRVQNRFHL